MGGYQALILGMVTNPEPNNILAICDGDSSIVNAHK
jgi:hypothetical protein